MAKTNIMVAIWSKNTQKEQSETLAARLKWISDALTEFEMSWKTIRGNQPIKGILIAPEYFFAAREAGKNDDTGTALNTRCLNEAEKDTIVNELLKLSKKYPKVLLFPGTIAWMKDLVRPVGADQKKDDKNKRTGPAKTHATREAGVLAKLTASTARTGARVPTELLLRKLKHKLSGREVNKNVYRVAQSTDVQNMVTYYLRDPSFPDRLKADFGSEAGLYLSVTDNSAKIALLGLGSVNSIMKNTAYVMLGGKIKFKYNKMNDFHEAVGDAQTIFLPGIKAGWVDIEGIEIGMEICLDHACDQLVNSILASPPTSGKYPHLHVIMSACVPGKKWSVARAATCSTPPVMYGARGWSTTGWGALTSWSR
jgi:hypothetical protein